MLGVFQNIDTAQSPQKIVGGVWNSGVVSPAGSTRLNYNGYLHATRFIGDFSLASSPSTIASGDNLIVGKSGLLTASFNLSFGVSTHEFLANNGTWVRAAQVVYEDRRTSNATTTTGNTNAVEVFSSGSLPAGSYEFITRGTITKVGTSNRLYQLIFSFDSTTSVSSFQSFGIFSPNNANLSGTGVVMSNYNAVYMTAINSNLATPSAGSMIQGPSNTSATAEMPFQVIGRFVLSANRTFRVHIRQNVTTDTTRVNTGASIVIYRVDNS
jgi:hypothetical protein